MTLPTPPSAAPVPASFVVLHGWENHRPAGHWQRWLVDELTRRGHEVRYPQLPSADEPVPAEWHAAYRRELATLPAAGVTVICHSLSSVAWLTLQAGDDPVVVDRVALVSPPSPELLAEQEAVRAFVEGDTFRGRLPGTGASGDSVAVAGDDDPWLPLGLDETWSARLDVRQHLVPQGGHLVPESGHGAWPAVLAWALGERGEGALG